MPDLLRTHAPSLVIWLAIACAPWIAGCDATAEPGADGNPLTGREFLLDSADGFTPVADTSVSVRFDENEEGDSFGFYAGCNHHSGPYEVRGGKLVLLGLGSTTIGCEQPLAMQDDFLSRFFTAAPELQIDGDRLTFTGEDATLVFLDRELADPDRPLTGRLWTVDTFISAGAATNLPLSDPPTVRFDEDGSLEVFAGCNTGGGSFTQAGGELTLSGMTYTEEGCNDPGAMNAELQVRAVLSDGMVDFEIEAARLTLMRGDRGLAATSD